jgi:hypothetical protein
VTRADQNNTLRKEIEASRREAVRLIHQRRCPACEQQMLRPFRFPSGTWGFECSICGQCALVAEWASRGYEVWRPTEDLRNEVGVGFEAPERSDGLC